MKKDTGAQLKQSTVGVTAAKSPAGVSASPAGVTAGVGTAEAPPDVGTDVVATAVRYLTPSMGEAFLLTAMRAESLAGSAPRGLSVLARAYELLEKCRFDRTPFTTEELLAAVLLSGFVFDGFADGESPQVVQAKVSRTFNISITRLRTVECFVVTAIGRGP